ncbi:voltage-gated purine nucleotide uniporter SLC17A9-like [Diretmus argenteus]
MHGLMVLDDKTVAWLLEVCPGSLSRRWTLMLFLGTCLLYCARMVMPICAVVMATTFKWSKTESGLVLGAFFWGYCLTQILGGHASDKLGGERVLFFSAASWAAITAVTPLLAQLGHSLIVMTIARFLMGLSQGVHFPSLASLCSQRVVEGERALWTSTMHSGVYLGTLLVGGLGSLMLELYGWESVFYGTGFLSAVWAFVVWQSLLKGELMPKQTLFSFGSPWSLSRIRWLSLLKKPPVCAMVFAHMCSCSILYLLMSWLPTFFGETFPHAMGWVYNVIPSIVCIPSSLAGGYFSDFLINQGYGVASVRKIMQCFAMGVSSIFILLLCRPVTFPSAVAFISAALGFGTFASSGATLNVQDLTPSCAGALYGFMNMCGAFMGLVLVSVSGYLIEVTMSWATVFSLITLVNVAGLGLFLVFGDANRVDLEDYSQVPHI